MFSCPVKKSGREGEANEGEVCRGGDGETLRQSGSSLQRPALMCTSNERRKWEQKSALAGRFCSVCACVHLCLHEQIFMCKQRADYNNKELAPGCIAASFSLWLSQDQRRNYRIIKTNKNHTMFWFHFELFVVAIFIPGWMIIHCGFQQTQSRRCSQGLNGAHGSQVIEKKSCFFLLGLKRRCLPGII